MRILAIDYGEKRMGFALGDTQIKTVLPLEPLIRKKPDSDLNHIKKILTDFGINKIIIGYPLNMNGSRSTITKKVEDFIKILLKNIKIDVEYVDERLSSFEAEEMIKPIIRNQKKRKKVLDSASAWIILRDFMEKQ